MSDSRELNLTALKQSLEAVCDRYEPLLHLGGRLGPNLEATIRSLYRMWVHEGDQVCDLGAHTGAHTLPLARAVGPSGSVLAFEVLPKCIERLGSRLQEEDLADRVRVISKAVGATSGNATFHAVDSDPGLSGLVRREDNPEMAKTTPFEVEVVRLDDLPEIEDRLSFIKADLEGGEFHALAGAEETLRRHRPLVVFESALGMASYVYGYPLEAWPRLLESIDYGLVDLFGCPMEGPLLHRTYPHYAVAFPREQEAPAMRALRVASLECSLDARLEGESD